MNMKSAAGVNQHHPAALPGHRFRQLDPADPQQGRQESRRRHLIRAVVLAV